VCVGPKGALNLSGSQFVTGEIRLAPGATLTRSGSAHVGGVERNVDLSAQLLAAQTAANTATALSPGGCTQTFATLTTARPIVGQGSGQNVICVKGDLNLQAGRVLTLQGVAGETFLFDVAGQFALGGASRIVARGGLGPKDVLFNIIGAGKDVVLGGNSSVDGTILAPQRRVSLAPGFIAGALVTGRDINIGAGASAIKCPPCSGTITASVVVRLSRLIGTLNAAGDLGGLGPSLIAEVERAMARMERADQLFDGGRRAAGRAFLRRAVHDLRRFEHRVRSHAGRSAIPAATRRALLALAEPIRVDLLTLMESL
jgi:choice-of-anchor A domain-containing protein